jgi:hypothetical protein
LPRLLQQAQAGKALLDLPAPTGAVNHFFLFSYIFWLNPLNQSIDAANRMSSEKAVSASVLS